MNIPDFNEFLETLTEEKLDSMCNYRKPVKLTLDENGSILLSSLPSIVNEITNHCEHFSFELLRAYHEWLTQIQ